MKPTWANTAIFYHIYPLGLCGAPPRNDFQSAPQPRLAQIAGWLDHIQALGATALYLGPVFESSAHGYDTSDYFQVDRRLGDRATLAALAAEVHRRGLRLVLDGVFNHVGRDFWAFRDLQAHRQQSAFVSWFQGVDFGRDNPYGDGFSYEGWNGHYDLVKLNLAHPDVRAHLLEAVRVWIQEFAIDGLRLDAADCIAEDFLAALAEHCRGLSEDFWLMGEMVHGDYRRLANPRLLNATTNYEVYKSLFSSHNDRNYFELAYALNRQSGGAGLYRDLALYNFADNHDVDRVASSLRDPAQLYPLYLLLFSMPGIPSIYYGSEWGLAGRRSAHSDAALRPALSLASAPRPHPALAEVLARLAQLRRAQPALHSGQYRELHVAAEQLAFWREHAAGALVVAVNASSAAAALELRLPLRQGGLRDLLNPGEDFIVEDHRVRLDPLPPCWGRILSVTA